MPKTTHTVIHHDSQSHNTSQSRILIEVDRDSIVNTRRSRSMVEMEVEVVDDVDIDDSRRRMRGDVYALRLLIPESIIVSPLNT